MSVTVPITLVVKPATAAFLDGNARGGWVLIGCALALIALATQASLQDVVTAVKRLVPRWGNGK